LFANGKGNSRKVWKNGAYFKNDVNTMSVTEEENILAS
jgi:hypothetical protein